MSAFVPAHGAVKVTDVDGWELSAELWQRPEGDSPDSFVVVTIEIPGEDTRMNVEISLEQWAQLIALPVPGA